MDCCVIPMDFPDMVRLGWISRVSFPGLSAMPPCPAQRALCSWSSVIHHWPVWQCPKHQTCNQHSCHENGLAQVVQGLVCAREVPLWGRKSWVKESWTGHRESSLPLSCGAEDLELGLTHKGHFHSPDTQCFSPPSPGEIDSSYFKTCERCLLGCQLRLPPFPWALTLHPYELLSLSGHSWRNLTQELGWAGKRGKAGREEGRGGNSSQREVRERA